MVGFGASSQIVRNRRSPHTRSLPALPSDSTHILNSQNVTLTNLICPRSSKKRYRCPSLSFLGQPRELLIKPRNNHLLRQLILQHLISICIVLKYTNRCFYPLRILSIEPANTRHVEKKDAFFFSLPFDMLLILPINLMMLFADRQTGIVPFAIFKQKSLAL